MERKKKVGAEMKGETGREYCRKNDFDSEGNLQVDQNDMADREISRLREQVDSAHSRITELDTDGCSHRGNDLKKIERIELATESVSAKAESINLSLANMRTDMVQGFSAQRIWLLANTVIVLFTVLGALFTYFVVPHISGRPPVQVQNRVVSGMDVTPEEYGRLVEELSRIKNQVRKNTNSILEEEKVKVRP
jgi:hypothetical protein